MNLNPFSLIPDFFARIHRQGISSVIPSLDSIVKIADPVRIPEEVWLRSLVDQATMPVASAILIFALACALIQEQRRAASGASDFTKVLYRLLFYISLLAGYPFLFQWIVEATQILGDLFLMDSEITSLTQSMYQQFSNWNLGAVTIGRAVLHGLVAYLTYLAAFIIFMLFFLARYMILALLFVIGPVVIAFSVWEDAARFRVWLVGLIQVASWVIILKFVIAVSLAFSFDKIYGTSQVNMFYVIAANILYVVMLWHTPAIASTLIGGVSLGFLGSQIIGITTQKTLETKAWAWETVLGRMRDGSTGGRPGSQSLAQAAVLQSRHDPYGVDHQTKSKSKEDEP